MLASHVFGDEPAFPFIWALISPVASVASNSARTLVSRTETLPSSSKCALYAPSSMPSPRRAVRVIAPAYWLEGGAIVDGASDPDSDRIVPLEGA